MILASRTLRFALCLTFVGLLTSNFRPAFAQEIPLGPAPWLDPSRPELWAPAPQPKAVSIISPVATGSKLTVRNAYNTHYVPAMPSMGFTGSIASCTPGTISTAFKEFTITRANYFRAMSGLPGNIALDTNATRQSEAQSASVLYSANTMLSHGPTNPPFTVCSGLIPAAFNAGQNSNIALAFGSPTFDDVIPRYMDDSGSGNEIAGHRRWILYPPQMSMTVGSTPTGGNWGANALRVFNAFGTRPPTPNGVAWPPAGFVPTQVLPGSKRWSYSFNGASFAGATVSMTANGAPIGVTVISNNANGYGDNTIVFVPTPAIVAGTNYTVTVSGITGGGSPASYTYTVRPFDATATIPGVTDLNGNGMGDLLLRHTDGSVYTWLMNTYPVSGAFLATDTNGWSVTHVADFDGDGKADILMKHTDGSVKVIKMDGSSVSSGALLLGAGTPWTVTHAGDVNGDGRADLLLRNTDGSVYIWTMNGVPTGGGFLGTDTNGWVVTHVADFNGDGNADIVMKHTNGSVKSLQMNGALVTAGYLLLGTGTPWTVTHAGDVTGDGRADIVLRHTDGSVYIWTMNGAPTGGNFLGTDTNGWVVTHMADFNGDGRSDIVMKHTDGSVKSLLLNGTTITNGYLLLGAGTPWTVTHTLDTTGDGKAEIILRHTDQSVYLWVVDGLPIGGAYLLQGANPWTVVPPQ